MIRFFLFVVLAFLSNVTLCQIVYPYKDIKLEKASDYVATEPVALSAATFLITTPFAESDANRANAYEFLSKWMRGNKAGEFYLQGKAKDINEDPYLLSLYMAGIVKYSLENKKEAVNPMTVEHNASKLVLAYCDDQKNKFKLKKKYRKILENE